MRRADATLDVALGLREFSGYLPLFCREDDPLAIARMSFNVVVSEYCPDERDLLVQRHSALIVENAATHEEVRRDLQQGLGSTLIVEVPCDAAHSLSGGGERSAWDFRIVDDGNATSIDEEIVHTTVDASTVRNEREPHESKDS